MFSLTSMMLLLFSFVVLCAFQDLSTVFDQLIGRAESCQKQIQSIVNPGDDLSNDGSATATLPFSSKYAMPQPEPVMIQAALKREADAGLEELLGNLNR